MFGPLVVLLEQFEPIEKPINEVVHGLKIFEKLGVYNSWRSSQPFLQFLHRQPAVMFLVCLFAVAGRMPTKECQPVAPLLHTHKFALLVIVVWPFDIVSQVVSSRRLKAIAGCR